MPVEFQTHTLEEHPITRLNYSLVTDPIRVGSKNLLLTSLSNVEQEIDRVFHWLESVGRPADEIENLAPYFGVVWPAALALSGFIDQPSWREKLRGKSVLEIGCGLAVPSMISAINGANVVCSDSHPDVPRFLKRNVDQIEGAVTLTYIEHQTLVKQTKTYDLVIASDVLYESKLVKAFADAMDLLVASNGCCVMADPGRPYIQAFANEMTSRGWVHELQPWSVRHNAANCDIYVMIFNRS
jgi:predicted nicotinamide N-methyase